MRKSPSYLTPAGRRWLRKKTTHRRDFADIGHELWAHEPEVWQPKRKRGRQGNRLLSVEDAMALKACAERYMACIFRREVPDQKKIIREIAREIDNRAGSSGELDAR